MPTAEVQQRQLELANDLAAKYIETPVDTQEQEWKLMLIETLAPLYLKPSTATTPEGMQTDATRDAQFFDLALRAAWAKILPFLRESDPAA